MKKLINYVIWFLIINPIYAQTTDTLKFIHIPHPRSEDKIRQSVLPAIEKTDFSGYDIILLGGDLTWYTSRQRSTLEYCDSLFDLGSPNTLWSMGNHDTENRDLIEEFTKRQSYFTYYRDGITFMVLDVELDANGFASSFISGDQLQMVKNVCDTIRQSKYLVVLHGRLLWMIGNPDLSEKLNLVAESTKQLDTTNFYQEVYPQLQKAKSYGVKVLCLGGDKSKINLQYSPEDSITFYATIMAPEFTDDINNYLVLNYSKQTMDITTNYLTLRDAPKTSEIFKRDIPELNPIEIWPAIGEKIMNIRLSIPGNQTITVKIYSINGILIHSLIMRSNEICQVNFTQPGMYLMRASFGNNVVTKGFVLP